MLTPKNFLLGILATILLTSFFSCEKNMEGPAMQAGIMAPKKQAATETAQPIVSGLDQACAFPSCEAAVEAVRLRYQQLANDLCDTVWMDITCCDAGTIAYALTYVAPNDLRCKTVTPELAAK